MSGVTVVVKLLKLECYGAMDLAFLMTVYLRRYERLGPAAQHASFCS